MSAKWPGEIVSWQTWSCDFLGCSERINIPTCVKDDREWVGRFGWVEYVPPGKSSWDAEAYCPKHANSIRDKQS